MNERTAPLAEAVDLFCGAGGLSYGMQRAGIRINAGIDVDPTCEHPFASNLAAQFLERNIAALSPDFIGSLFTGEGTKVVAGCVPCQPFSSYSRGRRSHVLEWQLLSKFGAIVSEIKPEIVTMENVPRLRSRQLFREFLQVLDDEYSVSHTIVRCADYGVPQTRHRLVLLASRLGEIRLIPPTHDGSPYATTGDAIRQLDPIDAGETSGADPLHRSSGLSELNLKRIRQSTPGGTWHDWDKDLRADCHIRDTGRTFPSVYGRMQWDKPAPTITTQFHGYGNGRFGHPDQDRALSLREGALLQTFPPEYSFVPDGARVRIGHVARLIGNAVPVKLGEAIGTSIIAHLSEDT